MLINKTPVTILMVVVAALCAYSRMYLGQHYLLDLAGGICVAMFILVISELGKNKLLSKMSINP
jgi:membrane-associated phospholipid phosphatase